MAYGTDIGEAGEEPVSVLGGQQHPQLFGLDKVLHHDVQTAAVGRFWGDDLKPHLGVEAEGWGIIERLSTNSRDATFKQ